MSPVANILIASGTVLLFAALRAVSLAIAPGSGNDILKKHCTKQIMCVCVVVRLCGMTFDKWEQMT